MPIDKDKLVKDFTQYIETVESNIVHTNGLWKELFLDVMRTIDDEIDFAKNTIVYFNENNLNTNREECDVYLRAVLTIKSKLDRVYNVGKESEDKFNELL